MICRKCQKDVPAGAFCALCGAKQTIEQHRRTRGNGQGTAFKRGKSWVGLAPGYSYNDSNGKMHRVRPQKSFATKKEALEWASSYNGRSNDQPQRLIDLWQSWSQNDMTKLSANKQVSFKIARKRIESIIARPINELSLDDLQTVVNENCETHYTARDVKTLLSRLYKRAMITNKTGGVTQNLAQHIVLPALDETEATPFSMQEVNALWSLFNSGDTFVGYILLMIYSGIMPAELQKCEKDMIDLEHCEIVGAGAKTKVRQRSAVVFPAFMRPVIEGLMAQHPKSTKLLPINKDNFYAEFYAAIDRAGIDNPLDANKRHRLTPYSCRHTTGTEAVKLGLHPAVIQQLLRHSNTKTQERYTHLSSADAHAAAEKLPKSTS